MFVVQFCLEFQLQMCLFKIMKVHLKKKAKDLWMTDTTHNSTVARLRQEQYSLRTSSSISQAPAILTANSTIFS